MSTSAAARLCGTHLLALGPDADPGALADVVWLGLQLALRGAAAPTVLGDAPVGPGTALPTKGGMPSARSLPAMSEAADASPESNTPDASTALFPAYAHDPSGTRCASWIEVPAGEALPQRLQLERALKPFKRRLASRHQRQLDPLATAEASAEWGVITPVYRATLERWFDVAILAEASDTMHIWDATLTELQRTLARHGAFRRADLWRYALRDGALQLSTPSGGAAAPRVLVDPQGRRLCWFVTSGTSSLWQHPDLVDFVGAVGRYGPTAIVQLMPSHMWPHTLLGDAGEVALVDTPGAPTGRLWLSDPFGGDIERAPDALTVPMTSLEAVRLAAWARFAMAARRTANPAVRLQAAEQDADCADDPPAPQASPRQRIAAFRRIASPAAFQLMRLLTRVPLSLPVMRLLQMGMQERAQVHLAEVLLSGLIERVSLPGTAIPPELVEYDFAPGVREELDGSLTSSEIGRIEASIAQIRDQARRFVEARTGSASATFRALAHDPNGEQRLLEQAQSFLAITQDRGLLAAEPQPQVDPVVPTAPEITPSWLLQPENEFAFWPENWIRVHVSRQNAPGLRGPRLYTLQLFADAERQCWLVASNHAVALVVDDAHTRRKRQLVQHIAGWLDILPVTAYPGGAEKAIMNFGTSGQHDWYYSTTLYPTTGALEEAVGAMLPRARYARFYQLRRLATEYDTLRAKRQPGAPRTAEMHAIANAIAALPLMSNVDLLWATRSPSPGVQLVAIVSLQRKFDVAYIAWLFERVRGDQAFLAFLAALALSEGVSTLTARQQRDAHLKALETRRYLRAAGLYDEHVHQLLDQIGMSRGSTHDISSNVLQVVVCATGPDVEPYRMETEQLLISLGQKIVEKTLDGAPAQIKERLDRLQRCDVVVMLIGNQATAGRTIERSNMSWIGLIELDYREAVRLGKPILVFMLDDTSEPSSRRGTTSDRVQRFRQQLLRDQLVKRFQSAKDFERSLLLSLSKFVGDIAAESLLEIEQRYGNGDSLAKHQQPSEAEPLEDTVEKESKGIEVDAVSTSVELTILSVPETHVRKPTTAAVMDVSQGTRDGDETLRRKGTMGARDGKREKPPLLNILIVMTDEDRIRLGKLIQDALYCFPEFSVQFLPDIESMSALKDKAYEKSVYGLLDSVKESDLVLCVASPQNGDIADDRVSYPRAYSLMRLAHEEASLSEIPVIVFIDRALSEELQDGRAILANTRAEFMRSLLHGAVHRAYRTQKDLLQKVKVAFAELHRLMLLGMSAAKAVKQLDKRFNQAKVRALPVIVLADNSSSMAVGGKIDALNQAMRDMLAVFSSGDDVRAEIHVAVITFGGGARLHVPLQPASQVEWADMQAGGSTPMGAAMSLAADLIKDRKQIPSRAYRPVVVLLSDGAPSDDAQAGLNRLITETRARKADRMALAIGADADTDVLRAFLSPEGPLFIATDNGRIGDFFEFVTTTMTSRSQAVDPNGIP